VGILCTPHTGIAPSYGEDSRLDEILIIVFDNEAIAKNGAAVLEELGSAGEIAVSRILIVRRKPDNSILLYKSWRRRDLSGTLIGTAVGGIIGLPAGIGGFGLGVLCGAVLGSIPDGNYTTVDPETDRLICDASLPVRLLSLLESMSNQHCRSTSVWHHLGVRYSVRREDCQADHRS
jgi:hypothetical protein